jgi:hypothetical protein
MKLKGFYKFTLNSPFLIAAIFMPVGCFLKSDCGMELGVLEPELPLKDSERCRKRYPPPKE